MGLGLLLVAAIAFGGLTWFAWTGALGFKAIGLLAVAFGAYWVGRRKIAPGLRKTVDLVSKVAFTIVGMMALLRHPIEIEGEGAAPIYQAIALYIDQVDTQTFVMWALIAMGVKFVGVIASAYAWNLLLVGQGIRFPFWQKIMTSFLIGRFIGTFLPSTIGLDGYTLYEAAKYSNQGARATTAKALEKFIGVTGLFLGMIVTLPFGYSVLQAVAGDRAGLLAGLIFAIAGGISSVVIVGLIRPGLVVWLTDRVLNIVFGILDATVGSRPVVGGLVKKLVSARDNFVQAVGAYEGKVALLFTALFAKFITHFTTAMVYFYTALAIGVVGARFWPVVFGSTIQILATLFSPTIAGEGAREAFQALLLRDELGGVAQAVLSGALGFIAAEAATMWGGIFLWTRTPEWRPTFCEVDGEQVDYAWLAEDDGGFSADKVAEIKSGST